MTKYAILTTVLSAALLAAVIYHDMTGLIVWNTINTVGFIGVSVWAYIQEGW